MTRPNCHAVYFTAANAEQAESQIKTKDAIMANRRTVIKSLSGLGVSALAAACGGSNGLGSNVRNLTPDLVPNLVLDIPPGDLVLKPFAQPGLAFDFPVGTLLPFAHGVASGDPMANRVIIWTRITQVVPSAAGIPVLWEIATDPQMMAVLKRGSQISVADRDWTVKVDVTGLSPASTYYYRFTALGAQSMTGRTRTAPAASVSEVRMAVLSCSSYWSSTWSGYGHIADRNDLDLVVHLGDYIYDFVDKDEAVRARRDEKDTAKADYRDWLNIAELRRRYALFRSDPNLLRAHQQHPFFIVWDNHDIDEDYGNELATPFDGLKSTTSLAQTTQVFHEWTPTRPVEPNGSGVFVLVDDGSYPAQSNPQFIYRKLAYGALLDIFGIDTQIYLPSHKLSVDSSHLTAGKSLFNRPQFEWFTSGMLASSQSGVTWRFVANQTWMAPADLPDVVDGVPTSKLGISRWAQYAQERAALCRYLRGANPAEQRVRNTIFGSGDAHGSFGSDLIESTALAGSYLPGPVIRNSRNGSTALNIAAGHGRATSGSVGPINNRADSVGVEFSPSSMGRGGADELVSRAMVDATTTSSGPGTSTEAGSINGARAIEAALIDGNKNVQFIEWVDHGYGIVSLTAERAIFEYWWQDKLTPASADVLGYQMVSWAEENTASLPAPHYRDQLDSVTVHGLAVAPTRGIRAAKPAPEAIFNAY
jgi:alkaline phosphatase D